jgi:hypothetical protein
MGFAVRKGLVWLLLATVAEVPPAVRLVILLRLSFSLNAILRRRCSCV